MVADVTVTGGHIPHQGEGDGLAPVDPVVFPAGQEHRSRHLIAVRSEADSDGGAVASFPTVEAMNVDVVFEKQTGQWALQRASRHVDEANGVLPHRSSNSQFAFSCSEL